MNEVPRKLGPRSISSAAATGPAATPRPLALLQRRRFQFAGALVLGALLPWSLRGSFLPGTIYDPASVNTLAANVVAVAIALWMRLSIETYPGIRRAYVILPAACSGHGAVLVWFVATRFPYD